MGDLLLLHSALGRRPGVLAFAQRLTELGHDVTVPDLYEGHVFDSPDAGTAHMRWLGWERLVARAETAAAELTGAYGVIGMSMGAGLAAHLAVTRPHVRAAVLLYGGEPPARPWPADVPVQVHHTIDDPWVDVASSTGLVAAAARAGSPAALYLYPGARHLLDDADLPTHHDPVAAALLWDRLVLFLSETV